MKYKPDWAEARQALTAWWEHRGLALSVTAIKDEPWEKLPEPPPRTDPDVWWYDVPGWLERSVYKLEIEALDAIEWTPQAGIEGGGSPRWYDLYRRIKAAGKSVQVIGVKLHEIEPLIEAVGPEGLYIICWHDKESEAREVLRRCGWKIL
jgi:hypothetical protein